MQIDFHFYTIYALARAAGFAPDKAHTVAYASQHTDDAKYEHALEFTNGGRFQQVLTAHRFFHYNALSKKTCYRIWIPFHFLPGNTGVEFYERMLTRADSAIAQRLVDDIVSSIPKPYLLQRLGIFLHVYADTFSHQNFLGLKNDALNDVKDLEVKEETRESLKDLWERIKKGALEYAAPKLGHAQAGTIPDEPYREWKYVNCLGRIMDISNVERATDAARSCYLVLGRFLESFPEYSSASPVPWHEITEKVSSLFQNSGDIEDRIKAWKGVISSGELGFRPEEMDARINYADREWFMEAVKVDKTQDGKEQYTRNPGFETSNWKYFHDAAILHRFLILHEVLPEYGMICG